MSGKITQSDFFKSLERLEALAGGGDDMTKGQIVTGGNSEPSSWPGGEKEEYGEGWEGQVHIGEDGTDYKAAKVRKSIMEKVAKGIPLNPSEVALLKGDMDRAEAIGEAAEDAAEEAAKRGKGKGREKDDDDDEDKPFGKSFADAAGESETIQKGIEVSDFLAEFAKSFGMGLGHLEQTITDRVTQNVMGAIQQFAGEQGDFNKSLAEAVVNIGHGLAGYIQHETAVAEEPAGPPVSQLRPIPGGQQGQVQVMNKSQGGSPFEQMDKSQILDHMTGLVEKGNLNPLEVVKFESTGEMHPATQEKLVKSMGQ
jgi:hypothetical protein